MFKRRACVHSPFCDLTVAKVIVFTASIVCVAFPSLHCTLCVYCIPVLFDTTPHRDANKWCSPASYRGFSRSFSVFGLC